MYMHMHFYYFWNKSMILHSVNSAEDSTCYMREKSPHTNPQHYWLKADTWHCRRMLLPHWNLTSIVLSNQLSDTEKQSSWLSGSISQSIAGLVHIRKCLNSVCSPAQFGNSFCCRAESDGTAVTCPVSKQAHSLHCWSSWIPNVIKSLYTFPDKLIACGLTQTDKHS